MFSTRGKNPESEQQDTATPGRKRRALARAQFISRSESVPKADAINPSLNISQKKVLMCLIRLPHAEYVKFAQNLSSMPWFNSDNHVAAFNAVYKAKRLEGANDDLAAQLAMKVIAHETNDRLQVIMRAYSDKNDNATLLIRDLQKYIERFKLTANEKINFAVDYKQGFRFFKNRQSKSRISNVKTAMALSVEANSDKSVDAVIASSNVRAVRDGFNPPSRQIFSSHLNKVLKDAIKRTIEYKSNKKI